MGQVIFPEFGDHEEHSLDKEIVIFMELGTEGLGLNLRDTQNGRTPRNASPIFRHSMFMSWPKWPNACHIHCLPSSPS